MSRAPEPPVLEAIGITKRWGTRLALDDVSLAARAGEIVGLLGPNGAGKTTTLSILSTIVRPDGGRILLGGRPLEEGRRGARAFLGLVPQSLALYPTLTGVENVRHFARMQGLGRRESVAASRRALEDVGLDDRAHEPARSLSGGMQRRLNLACGIVHRPAALLLDEPTVGVDLESRERILALVRGLRDAGTAVIYSTHTMEEAERICDRVLLIDRGRLVADGSVEDLVLLAGGRARLELTCRGHVPRTWRLDGVRSVFGPNEDGRMSLELSSHVQVGAVLEELRRAGARVVDFSLHSPNLADAFVALTGRRLRDSVPG